VVLLNALRHVRTLERGPQYDIPMLRSILAGSRAAIVHSATVECELRAHGFHKPVAKIPHGAWIVEADRMAYRARLGLDERTPLIGIFGFLKPYKRIAESLRAFRRLIRVAPDARMILVGEAHPELPLASMISSLDLAAHARHIGFAPIEDFNGYLAACDIVLNLRYPTVGESSGTLLRALGMGKAVVVSDIGSFREYPDEICLKAPVDASEEEHLFEYLNLLVSRRELAQVLGMKAREWVARECNWDTVARRYADFLEAVAEGKEWCAPEPVAEAELWFRRAGGGSARLGIVAAPLRDAEGRVRGVRGIGRDLTAERARDDALARARLRDRLLSHLVRAIRDELDPAAALDAAVSATGLALGAAGGVILRRIGDGFTPAASWGAPAEAALLDAASVSLQAQDALALAAEGWQLIGRIARYRQTVEGAILLWRQSEDGGFPDSDRALLADVADQLGVAIAQVAQHEQMLVLSRTDPLTGLLNRRAFFDELQRRLARLERGTRPAVLLFVDMDNFKLVNDRLGHRAGDEAIRRLCDILRAEARAGDLAARLGGDEFALWIEGLDGRSGSERAAALLRAAEALKPLSGAPDRPLGISIGVALVEPGGGETPEQIVARADAAMYRAKSAGKGGFALAAGKVPA
jgi:diguanylate cyclase (GGDEF)-like protein